MVKRFPQEKQSFPEITIKPMAGLLSSLLNLAPEAKGGEIKR